MSTKFTSGPWQVIQTIDQLSFPQTTICRIEYSGQPTFFIHADYNDHGKAEADANLIAAAPELLEALEKIAKLYHADRTCSLPAQGYNEKECEQIGIDDYAAQIAIEAIAKATGVKQIKNQQS